MWTPKERLVKTSKAQRSQLWTIYYPTVIKETQRKYIYEGFLKMIQLISSSRLELLNLSTTNVFAQNALL